MSDLQLVIPTHARPRRQITLRNLPPVLRKRTLIVTSTNEDAKLIRELYDHDPTMIAVARVGSIAEKRHWIMKYVARPYIFMMDDDIDFFSRCPVRYRHWNNGQWLVKPQFHKSNPNVKNPVTLMVKATPEDCVRCFQAIEQKFKSKPTHDATARDRGLPYAGVAMGFRMHNDKVQDDWVYNARLMYAFGINREIYLKERLRFDEVFCREDFNITLRLLRAGFPNAIYMDFMSSPKDYGAEGGASTERSMERSDKEADRLARLHPDYVKVKFKDYKTGIPRKEVNVQWKKAYMEAQV